MRSAAFPDGVTAVPPLRQAASRPDQWLAGVPPRPSPGQWPDGDGRQRGQSGGNARIRRRETVDPDVLEVGGQMPGQLRLRRMARHDVDQQAAWLEIRPCAPEELVFGTAVGLVHFLVIVVVQVGVG
ncbi:MAG: hypothetical protein IPJ94_11180 [Chloroflexi bacterium]|nr:hypothetical protein [Chloroflexota bacterium]